MELKFSIKSCIKDYERQVEFEKEMYERTKRDYWKRVAEKDEISLRELEKLEKAIKKE